MSQTRTITTSLLMYPTNTKTNTTMNTSTDTTVYAMQNTKSYSIIPSTQKANPLMMSTSKSNKIPIAPENKISGATRVTVSNNSVTHNTSITPITTSIKSHETSKTNIKFNTQMNDSKSMESYPPIDETFNSISKGENTNHSINKPSILRNGQNDNNNNNIDTFLDDFKHEMDPDLYGIPVEVLNLMEYQPTLNIMTIGDVNHGKSTLMWGLCYEKTGKHSSEVKKNATIKLGYTSCKIFKCINCYKNINNNNNNNNNNKICYFTTKSNISKRNIKCPKCNNKKSIILVRHISFVDCPGHAEYMATMISAACVADGAIMVIDASRQFPGLQTVQHTSAAHSLGVLTNSSYSENVSETENRVKVIVAQNKIDLITPQKACINVEQIRSFLGNYDSYLSQSTPIIPISAQSRINLDALCMVMVKKYPKYSPRLERANKAHSTTSIPCIRRLPSTRYIPRHINTLTTITDIINIDNDENKLDDTIVANNINDNMNDKMNDNDYRFGLESLEMNIIRSFDVNKQCEMKSIEDIDNMLHGGVCGGVIIEGIISIGDTVTILPGIIHEIKSDTDHDDIKSDSNNNINNNGNGINKNFEKLSLKQQSKFLLKPKFRYEAIEAKVIGLKCGTKSLNKAYPGANVGVMLNIDPYLTKCDQRVGDVICGNINKYNINNGKLKVFNVFRMSFIPLEPYYGIKITAMEVVKINIGSSKVIGRIVKKIKLGDIKGIEIVLERPICGKVSSKVSLTRKINNEWRLGAVGIIFAVRQCKPCKTTFKSI